MDLTIGFNIYISKLLVQLLIWYPVNLIYTLSSLFLNNTLFLKVSSSIFSFINKSSFFRLKSLSEFTFIDNLFCKWRFKAIYVFLSVSLNFRLVAMSLVRDFTSQHSLTFLYDSASWLEREVYDMFGCFFLNHPDLRRILTDYTFSGYPLRKDFPISGFYEIFFNEVLGLITQKPINLLQFNIRLKSVFLNNV